MSETLTVTVDKHALTCKENGCNAPIREATLEFLGDKTAELHYQCENGHRSVMQMSILKEYITKEQQERKEPIYASARTKVSGVTFENADGTKRQTLLQHVKAGDSLQIVKGKIGDAPAFIVKHDLGILGTVKKEVIYNLAGDNPELPIEAKVVQITGGTADKATLGCNIEITAKVPERAEHLHAEETNAQRPASKSAQKVYVDKNGRSIYHIDRHCSGLKNAVPESLHYAKNILKARPCKKCAVDTDEN